MSISVIQSPVGSFIYVGRVPIDLAFRITGGSCFDRAKVREAVSLSGPGLAKKIAARLGVKMESKSFATKAEAVDVAEAYVAAHNLEVRVNG